MPGHTLCEHPATTTGFVFPLTADMGEYWTPRGGSTLPLVKGYEVAQYGGSGHMVFESARVAWASANRGGCHSKRPLVLYVHFAVQNPFMRINDGVYDATTLTAASYDEKRDGPHSRVNVAFHVALGGAGDMVCLVLRDIAEGDELFAAYGAACWAL
jgi:hypothetical protein